MKGILFKPELIKAVAEGRKTQTRRVIKPQPDRVTHDLAGKPTAHAESIYPCRRIRPSYKLGETVYIKETWCPVDDREFGGDLWIDYKATPAFSDIAPAGWDNVPPEDRELRWRSPIFMPAWAARYFIVITEVKAQRVQEITLGEAIQEGVKLDPNWHTTALIEFQHLWDTINPKHPWESNPWVWVYTFRLKEANDANP